MPEKNLGYVEGESTLRNGFSRIRWETSERRDRSMRGAKGIYRPQMVQKFKTSLVVSEQNPKCLLTRKFELGNFAKRLALSLETCTILSNDA